MTMTPRLIEDEKFLDEVQRFIGAFHYSTKIPYKVEPKAMIDFAMSSHYGKGRDSGNSYGSKIHKGMKLRYAGNTSSPATDGHTIFFNKSFFTSEFYHFGMGVPEEYIPAFAVLFFHGIEVHESTHGMIISTGGHYNAKGLNESTYRNIAMTTKKNYDDIAGIKGRRKQVLIMAMNVVEDIYIDNFVVPTQFPFAKRLYSYFLKTLFGMPALLNQIGEELTINHIHYLRNPDPTFRAWLLRTYPKLAEWAKILSAINVGTNFLNRSKVVWNLYNALVDFLELPEEDEETEDEEENEEYDDSYFGSAPDTSGDADEGDETEDDLKDIEPLAGAKEREIAEAEHNHNKNHRWMEESNAIDAMDSDFTTRSDSFAGMKENLITCNNELRVFVRPMQYARHRKAPRKFGLYEGVLDEGSLHNIKEGNIFATEKECRKGKSDTEVVIVSDVSGSTFGRSSEGYICQNLLSLGYSLHTLLKSAGVAVASIAHTTSRATEIYGIAAHRMKLSPNGKVVSTHRDQQAYENVLRHARYAGNCDGAALRYGAELFTSNNRSNKIVIMVNDGLPAESHILGLDGENALKQELEAQRKKGIVVIAIAAIPQVYEGLRRLYGDKFTFRGYGKYAVEDSKRLIREMMIIK